MTAAAARAWCTRCLRLLLLQWLVLLLAAAAVAAASSPAAGSSVQGLTLIDYEVQRLQPGGL